MSRKSLLCLAIAALAAAGATLGSSPHASAQAPDIRDLRPAVMLLVDTSGSMEWETGQPNGTEPLCTGSALGTDERSRWATVLEALTGTWPSYSCQRIADRTTAYPGQGDQFYPRPHFRVPSSTQTIDGILDTYLERAKFGLMTVDSTFGLESDSRGYVPQATYLARLPEALGAGGMYSYGERRPFTFPGCATTFMVDGGARHASAPSGALISVGNDAIDTRVTNAQVQAQLLAVRPSWGTATGALLEDFRYYLATHPDVAPVGAGGTGDPYAACRARYAILITDGQDDDYFRDAGCGAAGSVCPYAEASVIAGDLCRYDGAAAECRGDIDGLFVVGFGADEVGAPARLNAIADRGGTGTASMATDRTSLLAALSAALNRANPGTTTRTMPAFATGGTAGASGPQQQYRFTSGFEVGETPGEPWSGVLDRTRFVCDATQTAQPQPLDPTRDSFHEILNARTSGRVLYTVATPRANEMSGQILGNNGAIAPIGAGGGSPPTRVSGLSLSAFDVGNAALTDGHFGISGGSPATRAVRRAAVINWVHGRAGTARATNRFGDIYHSSPVTVGAPRADIADESFNLFRRRPEVSGRPTVVYVGTNDGVLHCFATETMTIGARTVREGEEIWGFIPPAVVPRLEGATAGHQLLLDGTPVVHDVYYQRLPGQVPTADPLSPASYRTVLVMGLRGGGNSYFALDVTNPLAPDFLWQFTDQYMGATFARPAIGQVLVEIGGVLQERAIALLPGGAGDIDLATAGPAGPVGCPAQGIGTPPVTAGTTNARSRQRCWGRIGRELHWVDVVTGETIFSFDRRTFNAPVTGGVALFTGDVGTVATRAFVTDDDGVMWRIDFSSRDSSEWTARPFHDIFWDGTATTGQPAYEPPIVTTDTNGNVVVLQATGNIDQLDTISRNRVVSLTENIDLAGGTPVVTTSLNWEIRLRPGEQVTGPLELFEGSVYFGSFESAAGGNPCDYGQSRIWGVEYRDGTSTPPTGYSSPVGRFPLPRLESATAIGTFEHFGEPLINQIVLGVAVTQQITCVEGTVTDDAYIGRRFEATQTGRSPFLLTAQVSGAMGAAGAGTSSVRTHTQVLPAPAAYTRVLSWVPQADR